MPGSGKSAQFHWSEAFWHERTTPIADTWVQLPLENTELAPTCWVVGKLTVPLILTVELILVHNPPFWEVLGCPLKLVPLLQGRETEGRDCLVHVGR